MNERSSRLQTSAVCMLSYDVGSRMRADVRAAEVIWQVQTEGESWEGISALMSDDSALQNGSNRKATTHQPCPSPFLTKFMVVSEGLAGSI